MHALQKQQRAKEMQIKCNANCKAMFASVDDFNTVI